MEFGRRDKACAREVNINDVAGTGQREWGRPMRGLVKISHRRTTSQSRTVSGHSQASGWLLAVKRKKTKRLRTAGQVKTLTDRNFCIRSNGTCDRVYQATS